ncbi:MAG: hypothetical protein ACJ73D_13620 [Pyrinomonadaceae bacterium]
MRSSKFGVIVLISLAVLGGSSCNYYGKIMARKDLVDGSKAYRDRKFPEAARLFKSAASRDPKGETVEGRTAQLFLARTLHSQYIGDRSRKDLALEAIDAYKQALPAVLQEYKDARSDYDKTGNDTNVQKRYAGSLSDAVTTAGAVGGLYDNLQMAEQAEQWRQQLASDASYPEAARAAAYNSMAAKANTCANDITDTEATKKTITTNGQQTYQYVKPQNPADLDNLKKCIQDGNNAADAALALEPQMVKDAPRTLDPKAASDDQLRLYQEFIKPFESARSYKAAMAIQSSRLAEMEGRKDDRDKFKAQADQLRQSYNELGDLDKKIQQEIDERAAAKLAAESGNKNSNTAK